MFDNRSSLIQLSTSAITPRRALMDTQRLWLRTNPTQKTPISNCNAERARKPFTGMMTTRFGLFAVSAAKRPKRVVIIPVNGFLARSALQFDIRENHLLE